ncbi:MAG TPA: N-acetylmuramoyl-L-alanine amidase [Candidatus Aquilonibacter sp.]|nr:N-acetylmuramoyl-L-alanine amidase [Candidatus Aquilonibacter sp.]
MAIFLAGCTTTQRPANEPVSLNWPPAPQPAVLQTNKPAVSAVKSNLPPAIVPKPAPVVTWDSLASWAAEHKIGKVHQISDSPVDTYAVGSSNGVMVLEIGSHEATWNGVIINLGFTPELIDGEIYLNGLDLQKNLEPLLCEPPLTFPSTNRVIVIDPGHGGSNHGTHSVLDGRFEKEFTLDLALRLKPLLEAEGWTVFLTRTSDVYVANSYRPIFATAHHANLFISLHFNATADRDESAAGLETYCFTPTGMPSTVTRGYTDPWSEKLSSNDFDTQNLQLAVKMQGALTHAIGMPDRGVRHVRYIEVLRNQNCPAVLIENGYLSNPAEAAKIESADYRQKLAEAIAGALK